MDCDCAVSHGTAPRCTAGGGLAPPDPERWLPKWERSEWKKKRAGKKAREQVKGSQVRAALRWCGVRWCMHACASAGMYACMRGTAGPGIALRLAWWGWHANTYRPAVTSL